ncbi:MAG: helix-turn-helix domain-containing protein [Propionibacteriaceae bacterium]|nr:helix-turn-helix domain-containing protein [Propionibacteriaceae bacterium]
MERYQIPDPLVEMTLEQIGGYLSAWRKLQQLTMAQLAKRAGVSTPVVARLEKGQEGVGIGALMRVLSVLELTDNLTRALDPYQDRYGRELAHRTTVQRVRKRSGQL